MKKVSGRPFVPVPLLLRWFERNRRDLPWRRRRGLYPIWVSEVMLQQTQVETVVPYYLDFLKRFPTAAKLSAAPLQDVLKAWEGLGYYSRARNLWQSVRLVQGEGGGRIPGAYAAFRKLPGVGDYIAAAVLSIGRGLVVPVVDGNVLRVVCRWQGIRGDIRLAATKEKVRSFLQSVIPSDAPGRFNEAMMELGALVCVPKTPHCRRCPLHLDCFAFREGCTLSLPLKSKGKPVPTYRVALAVIVRRDRIFIQQRPESGHLGGLWEFPGGKCEPEETPLQAVVRECSEELGVEVDVSKKLARVRHAYSHFKIELHVYACALSGPPPQASRKNAWIRAGELSRYPFPAANHKFFAEIKEYLKKNWRQVPGAEHREEKKPF
ncbi:MAG TPA: A/G-specific adenine glycosylase [Candidatus Binatia bacterium]|nr:A/G-specific adenine glycosylase [Candidatus Binatia bacterium]